MERIEFDNTQAGLEGWGIFDCEGSANGPWQIQREDATEVFPDDDAAWRHVAARATAGSPYHAAAIDFIRLHNPVEFASFAALTNYGVMTNG